MSQAVQIDIVILGPILVFSATASVWAIRSVIKDLRDDRRRQK